jgi:prevent-host-death family protein
MSSRWNVASAKAELSRVLERARKAPQIIEKRGEPVAVVVGVGEYRRLVERERRSERWKSFLDLGAALRDAGGVDLRLPERRPRRSPFARRG